MQLELNSNNLMYLNRQVSRANGTPLYNDRTNDILSSDPSSASSLNKDYEGRWNKRKSNFGTLGNNIIGSSLPSTQSSSNHNYEYKKPDEYVRKDSRFSSNGYISSDFSSKGYASNDYKYDASGIKKYSNGTSSNLSSFTQEKSDFSLPERKRIPAEHKPPIAQNPSTMNFRTDGLNETFTSHKAKHDVSEYHKPTNARPVYSRERDAPSGIKSCSSDFSIIGLENIGNTCFYNVILQCLFHLKGFNKIFEEGTYKRMLNSTQRSSM